jgi:hypothetical protein
MAQVEGSGTAAMLMLSSNPSALIVFELVSRNSRVTGPTGALKVTEYDDRMFDKLFVE